MNDLEQNLPSRNNRIGLHTRTIRKDYPSEVEEVYQLEFEQPFDVSNCRIKIYAEGMAECLSPQFCHYCNNSIPFANAFFCKHPLLVKQGPK